MNFKEWLVNQQSREDSIGFLARVLLAQKVQPISSKRKPDEHRYWVEIVRKIDEPGYIYAFKVAWQEYVIARKSAEESSE